MNFVMLTQEAALPSLTARSIYAMYHLCRRNFSSCFLSFTALSFIYPVCQSSFLFLPSLHSLKHLFLLPTLSEVLSLPCSLSLSLSLTLLQFFLLSTLSEVFSLLFSLTLLQLFLLSTLSEVFPLLCSLTLIQLFLLSSTLSEVFSLVCPLTFLQLFLLSYFSSLSYSIYLYLTIQVCIICAGKIFHLASSLLQLFLLSTCVSSFLPLTLLNSSS